MRKLHVLYDAGCGFCRKCRGWMQEQRSYLEIEFIPFKSPVVAQRFPGAVDPAAPEELVVISDEGGVYRGPSAFIMCLYALEEYREWSLILSRPLLLPLARQAFVLLSAYRREMSSWLRMMDEVDLAKAVRRETRPCETCGVPETLPRVEGSAGVRPSGGGFALCALIPLCMLVIMFPGYPFAVMSVGVLAGALVWRLRRMDMGTGRP